MLIGASVWMKFSYPLTSSSRWRFLRPRAETMPIVTVWPTLSGLPMANTTSPTRSLSLSASVTVGRFWASILMMATSVFGSVPMTLALNSRSSGSATFSSSAPSTTWLLVRM